MHWGLPCSDATTDSDSKTLTSDDNSSPETCSPTLPSLKAETTRVYNMFQYDAVINMMLDDDMPRFTT
jgi:hypothetical protein